MPPPPPPHLPAARGRVAAGCVALTLLLLPALAAADEPVRLWHAYRDAELDVLVALVESHRAAGGAPVELLQVAHESLGSKLAAAIPLGDGPDLFIDSHERIGDFRLRGLLAPADPALDRDAAYVANALAAVRQDGLAWGVPLSLKCLALFINEDLAPPNWRTLDLEGIAAVKFPAG